MPLFALSWRSRLPAALSLMALSLLMITLTEPAAHAGTYIWTTTDPTTHKITAQSPTYSGGTYQGRVGPQGPDNSPQPDAWGTSTVGGVSYTGWGGDASFFASIGCSGKITATFTWQPASGQTVQTDPPLLLPTTMVLGAAVRGW